MSRIDELFESLKSRSETALMPFVTAGDPSIGATTELIRELDRIGCHLCEVGFPYSDPIADGPTIQASYTRAIENGISTAEIFEAVKSLQGDVAMPMVAMVSYSIVFRYGVKKFIQSSADAGFAGFIIPDLPVDESESVVMACRERDIDLIQLVTPTTERSRAKQIVGQCSGFIYYVSIAGITGEKRALNSDVIENVKWIKQQTKTPVCIGFGISEPEHVRQLSGDADGLIVGSAIVRRLHEQGIGPTVDFVTQLLRGLEKPFS